MTCMSDGRICHLNRADCDISITLHQVQLSFDMCRSYPGLLLQSSTRLSYQSLSWISVLQTGATFCNVDSTTLLAPLVCQYISKTGGMKILYILD